MLSRRELLSVLGALPAASLLGPGKLYAEAAAQFPKRLLGRTGRPHLGEETERSPDLEAAARLS